MEDEQKQKLFSAHSPNKQTLRQKIIVVVMVPNILRLNISFLFNVTMAATLEDTRRQPLVFHKGCIKFINIAPDRYIFVCYIKIYM